MKRTPTRFFLLDPTFAILLAAACIVGGLIAYFGMVRENNPDLAIPQATIVTEWPGASPEQIEKEITKPLEDEIRALPGLRDYASSSRNSVSVVSVQFQADVDIASAMQQLRARVDAAEAEFPREAEQPEIEQISVNDLPIMTLVLSGPLEPYRLNVEAERLQRELERIAGVRMVNLQGARDRAVHIRLDPARIRSIGLSPVDVRDRVSEANRDLAWGAFESEDGTLPLYLEGRFRTVEDIAAIPVARIDDQRVVRLGELGRIFIGLDQYDGLTRASIDGDPFEPAITLSIQKRPGADTLATIDRVNAFLERYTGDQNWPAGLEVDQLSDEGEIIRASFNEVVTNLLQGVAAVFVVLLLALTWREATVAALALPITLLAALLAVSLFGFTLNTLVILGMVIALGILVDVFILVMEGMHEGIYVRGKSFDESAIDTVKSYLMPAVAGQATTILAMVPLMTIGGIDGKFIRLIPFTAIACLVASLVIAFTVCIPLSRYLLKSQEGGKARLTFADRLTERASGWLQSWLQSIPLRSKRRAGLMVGLAGAAFVGAMLLAGTLPSIVYPNEDRRPLGVTIELRPDAAYADAERVAEKAGAYMRSLPYLDSVTTHAGERSPFALNTIEEYLLETSAANLVGISALFRARDDRERLAFTYLDEIRAGLAEALEDEPGVVIRLTPDLGGATGADPVQIAVTGDDLEALRDISLAIQHRLAAIPGVTDIRDTLGPFRTEARFVADAEALSFHRLSEVDLLEQVRIAMTADKIGTFQMPGADPDLDIRLGMEFRSRDGAVGGPREIHELETVSIITQNGERVPLTSLVDVSFEPIPTALIHADGRRTVTVKARLSGETTALQVADRLRPQIEAMAADWPDGFSFRFRGEVESAAETYSSAGLAFVTALLLVFAVLALLFGSFGQPFIIMAMAPLALTGVGLGFFILQIPISFPAMIGVIALIGIVVNDAIVMVEVINRRLRDGMAIVEAAAHGASDRLRPILTTSVTTIVGLTPLALSSPSWYPLCMAVILGLIVATLFALVILPCLYVLLTSSKRRIEPSPASWTPG